MQYLFVVIHILIFPMVLNVDTTVSLWRGESGKEARGSQGHRHYSVFPLDSQSTLILSSKFGFSTCL